MLFEHRVPFRPDWEAVLTPVVDAIGAREDVEADRIAVIGISQAGYWVPRALAFEHRFAAAVADPGVVDVSTSWLEPLPTSMRRQLKEGKQEQFDRNMRIGEKLFRSATALLTFRGEPYGLHDDSRFRLYEYRLGDELSRVDTPLLITDPEGEQFWPGQAQQLFDRLPGAEGAHPLHRGRGRRAPLRADGAGAARRAGRRLARPSPRARRLSSAAVSRARASAELGGGQ
jgi:hypothetical protein